LTQKTDAYSLFGDFHLEPLWRQGTTVPSFLGLFFGLYIIYMDPSCIQNYETVQTPEIGLKLHLITLLTSVKAFGNPIG
jgi:hypothetical protein